MIHYIADRENYGSWLVNQGEGMLFLLGNKMVNSFNLFFPTYRAYKNTPLDTTTYCKITVHNQLKNARINKIPK